MAGVKDRPLQRLLYPLLVLLSIPSVLAVRSGFTGVSPLNKVVEAMSYMFDIPILQNPMVQVGFIRFCLFVLFLAVARYAMLKAKFDNKTAGIIATVFAIISAFLMPENWVMANGGVITAVFSGLIPLGIIGGGIYLCLGPLNQSTGGRIIAIVILFALLAVIDVYKVAIGLPIILLIPRTLFDPKRPLLPRRRWRRW